MNCDSSKGDLGVNFLVFAVLPSANRSSFVSRNFNILLIGLGLLKMMQGQRMIPRVYSCKYCRFEGVRMTPSDSLPCSAPPDAFPHDTSAP